MNSGISLRWLGLNAFEVVCGGVEFLIDPYVSRNRELIHVPGEVEKYITGAPHFIFMTHSHWDHLGDTAEIIGRSGAMFFGSRTACNILRAQGVDDKYLGTLKYGDVVEVDKKIKVTVFESRHKEPYDPGFYDSPPEKLECTSDWRCGEVYAFLIEYDGMRILNVGSANLHLPAVDGLECDYFLCGISRWNPDFPELLSHLRFKKLIPTHHDAYTKPLSEFSLRGDLERLRAAVPDLPVMELEVLKRYDLPRLA